MDILPVSEAGAAPAQNDQPITSSVAVEIVSPPAPAQVLPTRTVRPSVATLHVLKPSVVTGQSVRLPVVRPQLVSVVKGQTLGPGARGQTRILPVVKMPAGSMSNVPPSMFVVRPRQLAAEASQPVVEPFPHGQTVVPIVKMLETREETVVDDNPQMTSLQELLPHPASSLDQEPDDQMQTSPLPAEVHAESSPPAESQPVPPVPPQPQPTPSVEAQTQPPAPLLTDAARPSLAAGPAVGDSMMEPEITLSCGSSYAAAMDSALMSGGESQTENLIEADVTAGAVEATAESVDANATAATSVSSAAVGDEEDDQDDVPLSVRMRKSSSRGRGRKRPHPSSASAAPPASTPPPAPFPCDDCEERFDDRLALAAHGRGHGEAEHPCGVCPRTFTQVLALRRHKLHHGQAPRPRTGRRRAKAPSRYLDAAWGELGLRCTRGGARAAADIVACGVCDEDLLPGEVAEHLSPPTTKGFFRCGQCGGVFGQRCQLGRHGCRRQSERRGKGKRRRMTRTTTATAAAAAAAEMEGSGDESLEGAEDTGSDWEADEGADSGAVSAVADAPDDDDDEPDAANTAEGDGTGRLTCDVCQINFVSRRNLQRHRAQHENGMRYSCEVCELSYARIDDLTRHSRSTHHQKRQFRCPRCMRTFTQKRIVQYHLRTHAAAAKKSVSAASDAAKDTDVTKTEPNTDEEIKDPPGPGPVRYTCEECGAGFDTRRRFTRHQQLRHDAETPRFECELCDASYARIDELTRHSIQIHHQKKTIPCPRCTRHFTQQRIVDYHVVGHDTKRVYMKLPRPFQCKECQRGFTTEALLAEHNCRNGKTSTQRCVCDICGRGISCPQALRRHRLQHNEERPAKCDTCGAGFIDELALSKHVLTHSEEKPYLCDHCGKGFRFKDYLVRHTRFHTGEKPYSCSACEKSFATSDTLNRHFLIHTGEKPFVCEVCARPFRQAQQLKTHMKVHRRKEVPPYLGQHDEKQEAQTLSMRLAEMTAPDVRLVEDVPGGV